MTFLMLQTFSLHCKPCPITADVAILVLYVFSSHCTTFSSYCRCDCQDTAQLLSSYCRCDNSFTAGFLLTPNTLSYYCRCNRSDAVHFLLTLHNTLLVLQMRHSWCCILLCSYCRCETPDTADFLLQPQALSSYCRCR